MDKPLVVIVQGSPRMDGNCAALALDAFNACDARGCDAVIVSASMLMTSGGHPCNGCENCVSTGSCVYEDEVTLLYQMLDSASGLLWITPIYFASVPGQLKAMIDRFQFFWARRSRGETLKFETRRPAAALIVGSGNDPFGTEAVEIPLTSASNIAEFNLSKPTVLMELDEPDAILREENAGMREIAHETIRTFVDAVLKWEG